MARIFPLYSGSSGNSYYIGSGDSGILIDVGRSARQTETLLRGGGFSPENVKAIFITHEHTDHVAGVRVLASRYRIPVYASCGTLGVLQAQGVLNEKVPFGVIGPQGMECAGMRVYPFPIPHDCAEGFGYRIETGDGRKIAVATDMGTVSPSAEEGIGGCDFVVIESNHDVHMLQSGRYPYPLKQRILSDRGHLSNDACAGWVRKLAQGGSTRFMLAHLSQENNTPRTAFERTLQELKDAGLRQDVDFQLMVAPRLNDRCRSVIF